MSFVPTAYLVRFAQLAALWAYSVSQPIFSFIQGDGDFLVLRDPGFVETIAFAVLVAFGVPLAVLAYIRVAALASHWVGDALYVAALALFLVPLAFQLVRPFEPGRGQALIAVLAVCALALLAYARWHAVRTFLTISVILPALGLALFVREIPTTVEEARAASITVARPTPVVVLVLDELPTSSLTTRSGEIDSVRYPSFGLLQRSSTWYANATTVHTQTSHAVPAILTGKMPRSDTAPTVADHPENLFTLLGETHRFEVHETLTRLCPANYCPRSERALVDRIGELAGDVRAPYVLSVLPRSLTTAPPDARPVDRRFERAADSAVDEFEAFVAEFDRDETTAAVHLVHVILPHHPWRFLPSGRRYGTASREVWIDGRETLLRDSWLARQALQRHLLQLQYTDALLGRLLRRLRDVALYDRALLVVVADHGASFRPGYPLRLVVEENFAGIASVPLFVKYPGQRRGTIDRRTARTIDVLPTVADVLGVRRYWPVDGISLLRPSPRRVDAVVFDGDTSVRMSQHALERQNRALTRRNAAWLGEGGDSLFAIGRNRDLLGQKVERTGVTTPAVRVRIEESELLTNVRALSGFVPALIRGVVADGRLEADSELAVSVNGRVFALTRTFDDGGTQRFQALVPEAALREGENSIDVHAVREHEGGRQLVYLGGTDRDE